MEDSPRDRSNGFRPLLLILFFVLLLLPLAFGLWLVTLVGPTAGNAHDERVARLLVMTPVIVTAVAIQIVYHRRQARRDALPGSTRAAEVRTGPVSAPPRIR